MSGSSLSHLHSSPTAIDRFALLEANSTAAIAIHYRDDAALEVLMTEARRRSLDGVNHRGCPLNCARGCRDNFLFPLLLFAECLHSEMSSPSLDKPTGLRHFCCPLLF